ncbi:cytochrome P450 [Nocardiopsis sp. HNM0947]|uniref:Cytochrome P450 n=1 Tax=Nocardiopsis coralli TaxID=2772213 RepID=A0ABR9PEM1_9ACTN|nr:cytochrome P450 [Nocardiopsis coralli]MBE3002266.1 cytochrome P450 [Nocardiopsis coralli]
MHQGSGSAGRGDAVHEAAARCPHGGGAAYPLHRNSGSEVPWDLLRERYGPLAPVELGPGEPGWLLLGYKENLQALRDQTRFSADPAHRSSGPEPFRGRALARDGEDHQRLRLPVVEALASVGTPTLVPVVERVAVRLLDRVAAEGSADLVGHFAAPLPALVLNELFGLPDEYGRLLLRLSRDHRSGDPERAGAAEHGLRSYFRGLVERKRAAPGQDVTSALLAHPHALDDGEAAEALALLWQSGHEPTTHLLGNALLRLLDDPAVWTAYLGGTLAPEDFVDYVMWTDPPIDVLAGRYPVTDLNLAGTRIRKGEPLLMGLAPAHGDPGVAGGRDDTMALAGNRSHLAWGAGAHRCPATALVRELVRTAIDTALDRLRGLMLSVEAGHLRRGPAPGLRGPVELPVWFTPTGEPAPEAEPEPERPRTVRRWVRRKRKPAPRGARYQAPMAEGGEQGDRAVPVARPKRAAPAGAGARYQAPFAGNEPEPDPLEQLLRDWDR